MGIERTVILYGPKEGYVRVSGGCVTLPFLFLVTVSRGGGRKPGPHKLPYKPKKKPTQWGHVLSLPNSPVVYGVFFFFFLSSNKKKSFEKKGSSLTCLSHVLCSRALFLLAGFKLGNVATVFLGQVSHSTVVETRFSRRLLFLYRQLFFGTHFSSTLRSSHEMDHQALWLWWWSIFL